ncbi:hypothetical protein CSPX01_16289 [Colletotrichum filicis]|nr:hypothetical protein CSPX01_16289 [Colletotrichum filicis]
MKHEEQRGRETETGRQINNCINGVNDNFCKLVQRGLTATEATESRDEPQSFLLVFSLMDDTTIALSMLLLFFYSNLFISLSSHLFPWVLLSNLFFCSLVFHPYRKSLIHKGHHVKNHCFPPPVMTKLCWESKAKGRKKELGVVGWDWWKTL